MRIEIGMNNSSGVFQVDELLATKLRGSGLEEHLEVVAGIEAEHEKRLCAGVPNLRGLGEERSSIVDRASTAPCLLPEFDVLVDGRVGQLGPAVQPRVVALPLARVDLPRPGDLRLGVLHHLEPLGHPARRRGMANMTVNISVGSSSAS